MAEKQLPKIGAEISVDRFHVSKMNVRVDQPFGDSERDKVLIQQIRLGKKVVGPFKVRPENGGYGVFVGRRRFLAKKAVGAKSFVVGFDCLIEDVSNEEAKRQSLIENLTILREQMDPITRAKNLNELISDSPDGLRGTARRLGLSPSTLSEWLKILDLSPKMQNMVQQGKMFYSDAVRLARMKIGTIKQDELAETLEAEGLEAFEKEVGRLSTKQLKRGIPKGKYIILRTTFDRYYEPDMRLYEQLSELAEKEKMKVDEYAKKALEQHVKAS